MSLLKKVFKKKPGGTLFGNVFRGVVSKATGGISDAVLKAPPKIEGQAPTVTQQNQPAVDYATQAAANLVNTKLSPMVETGVARFANTHTGRSLLDAAIKGAQKSMADRAKDWFTKNWWVLLFPVAGVAYLIYKKVSKPKSRSYSGNRRY